MFFSVQSNALYLSIVHSSPDICNWCYSVFSIEPDKERMEDTAGLIGSRGVEPYIQQVISLREARETHRNSEGGHVRGKLVLDNTHL